MEHKIIYFAGSFRGGRGDQEVYYDFIRFTQMLGVEVLCEHVGYANLTDHGQDQPVTLIHDRDLSWIEESDGVIAEVTNPSLGVGYEIHHALSIGKPVLSLFAKFVDGKPLSAMIAGAAERYPTLTNVEYVRSPNGIKVAKQAIVSFTESI